MDLDRRSKNPASASLKGVQGALPFFCGVETMKLFIEETRDLSWLAIQLLHYTVWDP